MVVEWCWAGAVLCFIRQIISHSSAQETQGDATLHYSSYPPTPRPSHTLSPSLPSPSFPPSVHTYFFVKAQMFQFLSFSLDVFTHVPIKKELFENCASLCLPEKKSYQFYMRVFIQF